MVVHVLMNFIGYHRQEILARTRTRVALRMAPRPTETELEHGVPLFLDHLIEALAEHAARGSESDPKLGQVAAGHGATRLRMGFTVDQLVHDYGDVCQAITELAVDLDRRIPAEDFRTLNKCLDYAIAKAVTEFQRQHELRLSERENERTGFLAHELRDLLATATLSFHILKQGKVGIGGSTGAVLERCLKSLSVMIDRSLTSVQVVASGARAQERVLVSELMEELQVTATIEASNSGHRLEVSPGRPGLELETDRFAVASAMSNLVRNAFKFSKPGGTITLRALEVSDGLRIEVEDQCGGLPPGKEGDLFKPFVQRGADRSGVGLGLAIARDGIRALGGDLAVRNLPGMGCIFSVELPLAMSLHAGLKRL